MIEDRRQHLIRRGAGIQGLPTRIRAGDLACACPHAVDEGGSTPGQVGNVLCPSRDWLGIRRLDLLPREASFNLALFPPVIEEPIGPQHAPALNQEPDAPWQERSKEPEVISIGDEVENQGKEPDLQKCPEMIHERAKIPGMFSCPFLDALPLLIHGAWCAPGVYPSVGT
jgi:hypothetical protein